MTELTVSIRNIKDYLEGDRSWSIRLSDMDDELLKTLKDVPICKVDVDFSCVDEQDLIKKLLAKLDEVEQTTRAEFEVKMNLLKEQRANLLSLTQESAW